MARKLFVAATGQNCGKTTISVSLMHLALKKYGRVGFIKPLGPKITNFAGRQVDKDAALMAGVFGLKDDIALMSPVVLQPDSTRRVLDGEVSSAGMLDAIRRAADELEKNCDFLIIEGSGHSGVGSVLGMSNARVARELEAAVMIVSGGGIGNVVDSVTLNLALFQQEGVKVKLVLANKLIPEKRETSLRYLRLAFAGADFAVEGGFNYSPILANPTLARIAKILSCPLNGSPEEGQRIVHHIHLGAASAQRVVDLLDSSSLLLVNSTRDELLVTLSSLYKHPEYKDKIAGLVIPGLNPVSRITQKILDGSRIPYIRTEMTNSETFSLIKDDVSKLTAEDQEKIDLIRSLADSELDFEAIDALL
ncbi:BioD-like N-terminal domain of phosphotransacetylase [Desulfuromonas soudanensis]|uniref:BioD-like N-terminal domain of phosphotransacetylase n=1 Tax=Desulfuromonas soudanensis TaxID=1603606 RepID=A0A0M4D3T7_9BACT|nr:AAA family ATPase [Desulfuromonas soudanensis]ALC17214.1 BioD-like N-terminal domain of phosphotransacetylase [Desulfuromonas soudanensis]